MFNSEVHDTATNYLQRMAGGRGLRRGAWETLRHAAEIFEAEALARVPVWSGELRNSITVYEYPDDVRIEIAAGENSRHAFYVEYGSSVRPAPTPYFEPARNEALRFLHTQGQDIFVDEVRRIP